MLLARHSQVYRLRPGAVLVSMAELAAFARWLGTRLALPVEIQGVTATRGGTLRTSVPLAAASHADMAMQPEVPALRLRRATGLALKADLKRLADWLAPLIAQAWQNEKGQFQLDRAKPRLPSPGEGIIVTRSTFQAFVLAACGALGIEVDSRDVIGTRDTGAGVYIRRRGNRTASIAITRRPWSGHGKACFVNLPDPPEDGYWTEVVVTNTYANGSYTETTTASGAIQGIGPDGTFDDCDDLDYVSTFDPEFDYGAFVSTSQTETLVTWDDVVAAALAAVDDAGYDEAGYTDSWSETNWEAASAVVRSELIGTSSSELGYIYGPGGGAFGGWNISIPRFRITNTGQTRLIVEITHTRVSDSTVETPDPISVAPGATSDWITLREPAAGEVWNTHITRIGMGGF